MTPRLEKNQRISRTQKNANKQEWFKRQLDRLDTEHSTSLYSSGEIPRRRNMKVNYDLYNNIINLRDFEYVCSPYGANAGELPAKMVNRDIISGKIKALEGMEIKRPFPWGVVATNSEATTRKEQKETEMIKEYVQAEMVKPIRENIEREKLQDLRGRKLTKEEEAKIREEIEAEVQAKTPEEAKKYIKREHLDPVEIMSHQLLEALIENTDFKRKTNKIFKNGAITAYEIGYIGIFNGEPDFTVVNPLRFSHDVHSDIDFIEDGESCFYEMRLTPSQVMEHFGDSLTNAEIDSIYEDYENYVETRRSNEDFDWSHSDDDDYFDDSSTIRVTHGQWKTLRKIGTLTYIDEEDEERKMFVDETYKFNQENGDIKLEWDWLPCVAEGWKIGKDIYKKMGMVAGQFNDIDNPYGAKLSYRGAVHDSLNSTPTSIVDRLKSYQYYYNIVMYRIELLMASDKGKKVLMNLAAIPDTEDIDLEKWHYFFESSPFMYFDPAAEGVGYSDVNTIAKTIDLSLVSDIDKYINIAEYLKKAAGESVGITPPVEGQTSANEAVSNTQQNLIQSSTILEPHFELHNLVKRNLLQGLLDTAKIAYSGSDKKKLSYILDDMSRRVLDLDIALLNSSTLGVRVASTAKASELKDMINTLAHAAMQAQKLAMSDVIKVLRQDSLTEAEEVLIVAEDKQKDHEKQLQTIQQDAIAKEAEKEREWKREEHANDIAEIKEKGKEQRKTEMVKGAMLGASFNPDKDADNDGVNDFLEILKFDKDLANEARELDLSELKIRNDKEINEKKLRIEDKKLNQEKNKLKPS